MKYLYPLGILLLLFSCTKSKTTEIPTISLDKFSDGIHHWNLYSKIRTTERLDSTDIVSIANNLVAYQNEDGGWPKNIDWLAKLNPDSVINALSEHYQQSTFDNRNIFSQIDYLAQAYFYTQNEIYKTAVEKGFQYILQVQYPQGGWRGWDADVVTYNDDVMTGIMELLLQVKEESQFYAWLSPEMRAHLIMAYEKGLQVILNCQIEVKGVKTAWCQQHAPVTYEPVQGRKYEHQSITARESSDVVLFLMKIKHPSEEVKAAIHSAVRWFNEVKIKGYDYRTINIAARPYHETTVDFDRVFVKAEDAQNVWARYYDLENMQPFLSMVDGTIVYELAEISFDRRVGYDWYGYWPEEVLKAYESWKEKN